MTSIRKLIGRGALLGLLIALGIIGVNGFVAYQHTRALYNDADWVDHTHTVLHELEAIYSDLLDAESAQRGYNLTGDDAFRDPYRAVIGQIDDRIETLFSLTSDNPLQQERMNRLQQAVAVELASLKDKIALPPEPDGRPSQKLVLNRGRRAMSDVRALIDEMEQTERTLLASRIEMTRESYHRAITSFAITSGLAAIILIVGYVLVRRDLVARQIEEDKAQEAARFNRLLLESTGEGIYGIDAHGKCTFINQAGAKMLGYEVEELMGKHSHTTVHHTRPDGTPYPESDCPIYKASRARKRGVRVDDELFFRKDGSSFPVEYASYPMREDGEAIGAVVSFSNITARKQAEVKLRVQEEQFRSMVNSISQLAWIAEANGDINWYNERWYEYTGTTFEQMKGWGWKSVLDPQQLDSVIAKFSNAVANGEVWEDTFAIRSKDGEYRAFLSRAVPIHRADGTIERWFGTNTDIEVQIQIERDLAAAMNAAEAANEAKSTFLANMSHELRTPLNAVILYSELLQEEAEDEGLAHFLPDLEKIRAAGRHLLGLINNILDLSKIEAGKMGLYLEPFDVAEVVKDVQNTIMPLFVKQNNSLDISISSDVGTIHADQTKVRQILFNLLSNASKFTSSGSVKLTVDPREDSGQDGIIMQVSDTGIGMTPDQVGRLFQPFTQADASTTRKFGGTGLGLAIVKRFCEMMGGQISMTSEPGVGTTFTVWLPREVEQPKTDSLADFTLPDITGPDDGLTVLVIDDDPSVRELLTRVLSKEGYQVKTAADGAAGVAMASTNRPDIIVLDVMMPQMDGWAVLSSIKANPQLDDVPVIMHTMTDDKSLGYALGAAEYLTKPVDRDHLVKVLDKYRDRAAAGPILVVEDNPDNREALCRALVNKGWQVTEAENGRVALDRLAETATAVIILDLTMPEMDGFEFLDEMRKVPDWADIPVIVLTARELTDLERSQLQGQVEKVIQKGTLGRDAILHEVRRLVAAMGQRSASASESRK